MRQKEAAPIPIAVVIDFGRRVTYSAWLRFISLDNTSTVVKLVSTPDAIPTTTAL